MARTADDFLLAFHRARPGATAAAFARGAGDDGRSSYQRLADAVPGEAERVVDLGCGCGHLLERLRERGFRPSQLCGIDMSPEELALARERPALAGVRLACEHAQWLSLPDRSVDAMVSHLAFMLMSDIERVVDEIARVLVPGAWFTTAVGGGPRADDAFELFLDLFRGVYERQDRRAPRLGDRRARSDEGVRELFGPHSGFEEVSIDDVPVRLDGSVDEVWASLSPMYEMFVVDEPGRDELWRAFRERANEMARDDGTVPCTMAIRVVRARRRG